MTGPRLASFARAANILEQEGVVGPRFVPLQDFGLQLPSTLQRPSPTSPEAPLPAPIPIPSLYHEITFTVLFPFAVFIRNAFNQ